MNWTKASLLVLALGTVLALANAYRPGRGNAVPGPTSYHPNAATSITPNAAMSVAPNGPTTPPVIDGQLSRVTPTPTVAEGDRTNAKTSQPPEIPSMLQGSLRAMYAARKSARTSEHSTTVSTFTASVKNWYFWDHYLLGTIHLEFYCEAEAKQCFDKAIELEPRLATGVTRVMKEYQAFGRVAAPQTPLYDLLAQK